MDINKITNYIPALITTALNAYAQYDPRVPREIPVLLSTVNPVIQTCFDSLFSLLGKKDLTKVECTRLGISYSIAVDGINEKTNSGAKLREDSFFAGAEYSSANQLLESAIKATIDDTETIKSVCYGRFMANIPFKNCCDIATLQSLNTIIKQLTYKEICLIRLLYDRKQVSSNSMEDYLQKHDDIECTVLFNQLLHLQNLGILITMPPFILGVTLGNVKISTVGLCLYEMMELNRIPEEDLCDLNSIVSRVSL